MACKKEKKKSGVVKNVETRIADRKKLIAKRKKVR